MYLFTIYIAWAFIWTKPLSKPCWGFLPYIAIALPLPFKTLDPWLGVCSGACSRVCSVHSKGGKSREGEVVDGVEEYRQRRDIGNIGLCWWDWLSKVSPDIHPPSREWWPSTAGDKVGWKPMALKSVSLMCQVAAGCFRWKSTMQSRAWMLSQGC